MRTKYDPSLDAGIYDAVEVLRESDVETFESCEGGSGHAYPEPTVRLHGDQAEGLRALAESGLPGHVWTLRELLAA
jgi:hypothetical protein